jgi:hypothetical protein
MALAAIHPAAAKGYFEQQLHTPAGAAIKY